LPAAAKLDVNLREQLGVEERSMLRPLRVIYLVSHAKCVERV
jgi:hypothetical protein